MTGFEPSAKHQIRTAKLFGITQKKDLDRFVLQKIVISRLGD